MAQMNAKLAYCLDDPNMGILERAGLAGLYLTLEGADVWAKDRSTDIGHQARRLKQMFEPWDLSKTDQLHLNWKGNDDLTPLKALVEWAWQVEEGVFFLPGVHRTTAEKNNRYLRVPVHRGILSTFLQHNQARPAVTLPKDEEGNGLLIELEEGKTIQIKPFAEIPKNHKGKPNLPKQMTLLPTKDKTRILPLNPKRRVDLSGAYHPGIAPRFGTDKRWEGPPEMAFLLLFAPIACLYLELPRNRVTLKQGKQVPSPNWAVIIPDIVDLHGYAEKWPDLHRKVQERFERIRCHSMEDATLQVALEYSALQTGKAMAKLGGSPKIYAFCMGRTSFQRKDVNLAKMQMIRKQVRGIRFSSGSLNHYQKMMAHFDNRIVPRNQPKNNGGTHWIKELFGRGRIASNIAEGNAWYEDLTIPTEWERDSLAREQERYNEKRGEQDGKLSERAFVFFKLQDPMIREALMALSKDSTMYECPETEMVFLKAMHDVMATLFWQEREALKKRLGLSEGDERFKEKLRKREEDLVDDLRRSLMEAQTREILRRIMTEWLARGGTHETIRIYGTRIWGLINDPRGWKKARDLALLGTVTYESRGKIDSMQGGGQ